MVTKNYNISFDGKSLERGYDEFLIQYEDSLQTAKAGEYQIYDLDEIAVILFRINKEDISKRQLNNLILIGTEENLQKTINKIKSRGFSLDERI